MAIGASAGHSHDSWRFGIRPPWAVVPRRLSAPRPLPGEQRPPLLPYVAGRAEAVQQQQNGLPAAALVNPQASFHAPQSATGACPARPPRRARGTAIIGLRGTDGAGGRPGPQRGTCPPPSRPPRPVALCGRSPRQRDTLGCAWLAVSSPLRSRYGRRRSHAVQATGSRLTPRWKFDRRYDGWPAYLRQDVRASTSLNSARIWVRARWAPRQKCGP
jgi:hypothetical protein